MPGATMRVGVVGHRRYDQPDRVAADIDAVLERVVGTAAATVVSSLAEGADRVVARRVLARPGSRLEAVLPLPADDFRDDFGSPASVAEFDDLLAQATAVEVVAAPAGAGREDCYELAAHAVVLRSDVVLAVWDGEPGRGRGGTAGSVAFARQRNIPVEVVAVTRDAA